MAERDPIEELKRKFYEYDEAQKAKQLSAMLHSEEGRTLLWWLLGITGTDNQPYQRDPGDTAFRCGELNIGLQLKAALIEADPEGFVHLLTEKANEHRDRDKQLADAGRRAAASEHYSRDPVTYHDLEDGD